MRFGMQIAFGRVRRKTAPIGAVTKTRSKNGKLGNMRFGIAHLVRRKTAPIVTKTRYKMEN